MSPRTSVIAGLLIGAGALLGACGEPPQPLPTSPPYVTPSAAPISIGPSFDFPLPTTTTQPYPTTTYPAYPTLTAIPAIPTPTTTTPPATVTAAPTPPAARCASEPTGPQILEVVKQQPGVPDKPLRILDGPFCSSTWSFAKVQVTGAGADDLEPLSAVLTGRGDTLKAVAVGSDPCSSPDVRTSAPPGIRVLACGPERPGP